MKKKDRERQKKKFQVRRRQGEQKTRKKDKLQQSHFEQYFDSSTKRWSDLTRRKRRKKNRKHSRIFSAHEPSAYSSEQNKQTTIQRIFKKITKTKGLKAERQDCFFVFIWCALSLHFAHFGFGDAHQKNISFVTFSLLGFFLVRKQERVFFLCEEKVEKRAFATQLRESWSS